MIVVIVGGGFFVFVVLVWSAFWIWTVCQTSRRESLLQLLELTAEQQLPLGPALRALADTYRRGFRARVFALAAMLDRGVALPDALDRLPDLTDAATRVVTRFGWEAGVLRQALLHAQTGLAQRSRLWYALLVRLGYPILLIFYCQAVVWFLMFWVAPKLQWIFEDHEVVLPTLTQRTLAVVDLLLKTGAMAAFSLWIAALVLGVLVYAFLLVIGYEPAAQLALGQRLFGSDRSTLLRSLALGVESGRPMDEAVRGLAAAWPHRRLRHRLQGADATIRAGTAWTAALRLGGLIRPADAPLLDSAQRAGNLAWALRALAERNERRIEYWLQVLVQLTSPILVIAVGIVVGVIVVAYFWPLVTMLQENAAYG